MRKTSRFFGVVFLLLCALLGTTSLSAQEAKPFVTKWQGKKNQLQKFPIFGKEYKLLIKDETGKLIETKENLTVTQKNEFPSYTPAEDGIFILEVEPAGVEHMQIGEEWYSTPCDDTHPEALLEVLAFGDVKWTSMAKMFYECKNMNFAQNIDTPNLEGVKNVQYMFKGCTLFNAPIGHWDMSHVENMEAMLISCKNFNQPLNDWKVGNVKDMNGLFNNCHSFNQPLDKWDVSKVEDMSTMFQQCYAFNQDITGWKTGNVKKMACTFIDCYAFNQPIGDWDLSNVENTRLMFANCHAFNQSLEKWKVGKVTDMHSMFSGCVLFNQPLNEWDVSNVTDMSYMFSDCSSFNQPLNKWNVSSVTDMGSMFSGCYSFNQPLGSWKIKTKIGGIGSTAMSVENYSNTLVGWAAQTDGAHNIDFGSEESGLFYNTKGKTARQTLIGRGWIFHDDVYQNDDPKLLLTPAKCFVGINEERTLEIVRWGVEESETVTATASNDGVEILSNDGKTIRIRGKKVTTQPCEISVKVEATASHAALEAKREVRVLNNTIYDLYISPLSQQLTIPQRFTPQAFVTPGKATEKGVTWRSDNPDVATVDPETGEVTAVGEGSCSIFAKSKEVGCTKPEVECKVSVKSSFWEVKLDKSGEGELAIVGHDEAALKQVKYGTALTVTATPDEAKGYELKALTAGDVDLLKQDNKFVVKGDVTVKATFTLKTFKVEQTKEGEGKLDIAGATNLKAVPYGTELTVTATPDEAKGYELKALTAGDVDLLKQDNKFVVKGDVTVKATFTLKTFKVEQKKEGEGTLVIAGATNLKAVPYGTELTVTATPDGANGYELKALTAGEVDLLKQDNKFVVKGDVTVKATFTKSSKIPTSLSLEKDKVSVTEGEEKKIALIFGGASDMDKSVTVDPATNDYFDAKVENDQLVISGKKETTAPMKVTVTSTKDATLTASCLVTVTKKEEPPVFKIKLHFTGDGTLAIKDYAGTQLDSVKNGTELTVIAEPAPDFKLTALTAGTENILDTKKFIVTSDVEVTATFTKEISGAADQTLLAGISVVPNPFGAHLRIRNEQGEVLSYELFNTAGVVLRAGTFSSTELILDTESLPAGVYFVHVKAENAAKKILKVVRY